MADHLRAELAVDALQMALDRRQTRRWADPSFRPWQPAQYTAGVYTRALEVAGLRQSMGHVATCFANALAESLFATLKTELVHTRAWPTRQAARTAIDEYLEVFYNRRRRHSALGYLSPTVREEVPPAAPCYPRCRLAIPCLQNRVNPRVKATSSLREGWPSAWRVASAPAA